MDNSEHQKDCICVWCEVERENAATGATEKLIARRSASPCSGFGVRIIHQEWSERVFYYWTGGAVSVEGKETRKRAIVFETLEEAIECAKGIREWLLKSRPTPIDWQVCKLPSWRVAKKSLPNVTVEGPPAR